MIHDLKHTLAKIELLLQPDHYARQSKAAAYRQIGDFLTKIKGGIFQSNPDEYRILIGSSVHVQFHADPEQIVVSWTDSRGTNSPMVQIPLRYDPVVDAWVGGEDDSIVPIPGQRKPLKDADAVFAEALFTVVEAARNARQPRR